MGASRCKECGGSSFSEDLLSGEEVCEGCNLPRPQGFFRPKEEGATEGHQPNESDHVIPSLKSRAKKSVWTEGKKDKTLTRADAYLIAEIKGGDHRALTTSDFERSEEGVKFESHDKIAWKKPEYHAMRRSWQFLGISNKRGERKVRAAVDEQRLCPPFAKSRTTSKNPSGERIYTQDIDAIVARKYMAILGIDKTRPRRKAISPDDWGTHDTDWILWELYVHLTIGNGRPWFISEWIEKHGLSEKLLRIGGPCSRECIDFLRSQPPTSGGIEELMRLLVDEGIDIHDEGEICAIASQLYEDSLPHIGQLKQPALSLEGNELKFHVGSHVRTLEDETEWWVEAEHSAYLMRHVPMAFAILQAMFDSRLHRTEAYASICAALRSEVTRYTSLEWDDSSEAWASAMQSLDKVAWCQD